jgi:4a-hydroxytetrahydrobiopterin dehydratase
MMTELANRHCVPCEKGTPPLSDEQVAALLPEVPGWTVEIGKLIRDVVTRNFAEALALVNRIGAVAETEGHHPDISIHQWNHVGVALYTHSIGGLSDNDFILAGKINAILDAE